jgi:hypothetical protein
MRIVIIISILTLCLIGPSGHSQETFNKRYSFYEGNSGVFSSIVETSDGFLASAISEGTMTIIRLNASGEVLDQNYFQSESIYESLNQNNLQWVNDTVLVHVGLSLDSLDQYRQFLVWLNDAGDTLETKYHTSFFFGQEPIDQWDQVSWYSPRKIVQDADGFIYESAVIRWGASHLRKYNSSGSLIWEILFDEENNHDNVLIECMTWDNENLVLPIYFYKWNGTFETYSYLYFVNPEGEILDEILIPEVTRAINDITRTSGGDFILATNGFSGGSYPRIVKIDNAGDLIWEILFDEDNYSTGQEFTTIEQTIDGHYVVAGQIYDSTPENEQEDGLYNYYGQIIKFTEDGQILWDRRYDGISSLGDNHNINDLKSTLDGGFIFCGESRDGYSLGPNFESPGQQGWIVKLDEFGCLVPGCQNVGVDEIEIKAFIMGPNPAVDHLNIYVGSLHEAAKIVVTDMNGREIKSFNIRSAATTYMLDIDELASGTYVMSLLEQNEVLHSEVLVVE